MTRMTGPDCVVMCNLINTHTHTHTIQSENGNGTKILGKRDISTETKTKKDADRF